MKRVLIPNKIQADALSALRKTKLKKATIVMPTGTGKTFMSTMWFKEKLSKNPKAKLLFICHSKDILVQAKEREFVMTLSELNLEYGYYHGEEKSVKQMTFATVQTLLKSLHKFSPNAFDYIIIDEVHHYQANTFKKVIAHFNPKFLLGMTATPNRMDGRVITEVCGDIIYEAKISKAIEDNLLSKINYYMVENSIDFSKIKHNRSTYDEADLNRKICIPEFDKATLEEYRKTILGTHGKKKTIVFCATVEHAHRMSNVFNKAGIKAVAFTGMGPNRTHYTSDNIPKREEIMNGFRNGKYDVIFVRDLFNEGVDIPDADSIMMMRPTKSHTIFTQQIGRGLRKSKNKDYLLVLDFVANAKKCSINYEVLSELLNIEIKNEIRQRQSEGRQTLEIITNNGKVFLRLDKINIFKNQSIETKCINCQKAFNIRKSHLARGDGKYCSKRCYIEYGRVRLDCARCNIQFTTTRFKAKNGQKYCSEKCAKAPARPPRKCLVCSKSFRVKPSHEKRGDGKYCSRNCYHIALRTKPVPQGAKVQGD